MIAPKLERLPKNKFNSTLRMGLSIVTFKRLRKKISSQLIKTKQTKLEIGARRLPGVILGIVVDQD